MCVCVAMSPDSPIEKLGIGPENKAMCVYVFECVRLYVCVYVYVHTL